MSKFSLPGLLRFSMVRSASNGQSGGLDGFSPMLRFQSDVEASNGRYKTATLHTVTSTLHSFFFFFRLRAHHPRVDYSGACGWGCSLLYWSGRKKSGTGGGGGVL